jgi:general stress protein 26
MDFRRRDFIVGAPAVGIAGVLAAGPGKGRAAQGTTDDLYRIDDPATIMAAAREIMKEDWVGVLVTVDQNGMPRARPVGVGDPTDDWSLGIATRRGSRKTKQIAANPKAALHFGFDDITGGHKNSYYASFMGVASVHIDAKSIAAHGPGEEYRGQWPDYPNDLALIRFKPEQLEVMGKGIKQSKQLWQPQGVDLPRKS